jgi:hypothetical protein
MEMFAAYDPFVIFGLSIGLVLTLCLVILYRMRDPFSVPPHPVSRTVWCASRRSNARVDFVEWVKTGMVHRSVRQCSLRATGGSCDESCCHGSV